MEDDDWRQNGACRGMDPAVFFPAQGQARAEAKRTCARCLVKADCLEYAMGANEPYGIWGGLNEKERRRLRRERRLRAAAVVWRRRDGTERGDGDR